MNIYLLYFFYSLFHFLNISCILTRDIKWLEKDLNFANQLSTLISSEINIYNKGLYSACKGFEQIT